MPGRISGEMIEAMRLIENEDHSPYAAAEAVGIEVSTVYRSRLFLDHMEKTTPVEVLDAANARVEAGESPREVAKEMELPVAIIYRSGRFSQRVIAMLDQGANIKKISSALDIPVSAIQKLPVYLKREAEGATA